jgi:Fe-S-cluster containining protein
VSETLIPPAGTPATDEAVPVNLEARPPGGLSLREARQSPCLSCPSSPCCTHLMLRTVELTDLEDVDYAQYLLNFEGLLLGFAADGRVRIYLHQPCGHLDGTTGLCTVHGTDEQPSICVHYADHTCKYRVIMLADAHPAEVLVDRRRLAWWAERVTFDDLRQIETTPEWGDVVRAFARMPLERHPAPPPAPDPVEEGWQAVALGAKPPADADLLPWGHTAVSAPCEGCEAWCCSTLVFSRPEPGTASDLDFFRYSLGFPGVRVGVAEDGWAIVVKSRCRHLADGRCSVYGTPERPLRCSSYDPLRCTYRKHFGQPVPDELVLVDLADFPSLAAGVAFDRQGQVKAIAGLDELRGLVAAGIRERSGV